MRFVTEPLRLLCACAALLGASGCGDSSPDLGDGCVNDCESNLWPRLIVDVPATQGTTPSVQITARYEDGRVREGTAGGCPEIDNVLCTASFGGGPADTTVLLRVEQAGQPAVERGIALSAFNYCGREIAYVVVSAGDGAPPQVGTTRYLSPCSGLK